MLLPFSCGYFGEISQSSQATGCISNLARTNFNSASWWLHNSSSVEYSVHKNKEKLCKVITPFPTSHVFHGRFCFFPSSKVKQAIELTCSQINESIMCLREQKGFCCCCFYLFILSLFLHLFQCWFGAEIKPGRGLWRKTTGQTNFPFLGWDLDFCTNS